MKEVTRAKDSAEASLAGAQKQVEDQTRRLLEAEEQLQIAKEQIVDLKKKLAEAEGAKNVAIWARDEAVRAKGEAEFARTKVECSKEAECVFYPLAIREDATPSSEVRDAPEEIEVASPSAAPEIISPQVPTEGSGPSGMVGADESQDLDAPKKTTRSVSGDPVPFAVGSKDPEISPAQPSLEGIEDKSLV